MGLIIVAGYAAERADSSTTAVSASARAPKETYRLVHAIGNSETINARGLTKSECESRKKDTAVVATTLGVGGSVTCLPESLFK